MYAAWLTSRPVLTAESRAKTVDGFSSADEIDYDTADAITTFRLMMLRGERYEMGDATLRRPHWRPSLSHA